MSWIINHLVELWKIFIGTSEYDEPIDDVYDDYYDND